MLPVTTDSQWQLVDKEKSKLKSTASEKVLTNFVPAKGTAPIPKNTESKKRKAENDVDIDITKKFPRSSTVSKPRGLLWDGDNYSCAYDALFTVLYYIWKDNKFMWNVNARHLQSQHLQTLGTGFLAASQGTKSLEEVRDAIRKTLYSEFPHIFPYGHEGTSLSELTQKIFSSDVKISKSQVTCTMCDFFNPPIDDETGSVYVMDKTASKSTFHTLNTSSQPVAELCPECQSKMISRIHYVHHPGILLFDHSVHTIKPSKNIKFAGTGNRLIKYKLQGLLYFGNFHFTSCIISPEGDVWYHDGMTMDSEAKSQGHTKFMSGEDYQKCYGRKLVMSIYVKS